MKRFLAVMSVALMPLAHAAEAGFPTVTYKAGLLTARPAPDHAAQDARVEILESEECSASTASRESVRVAGRCEFLKAMYSYRFKEAKSGKDLRTLVGFTFSSQGPGHTLMVSGPFTTSRLD
jgi:hypothetical protein